MSAANLFRRVAPAIAAGMLWCALVPAATVEERGKFDERCPTRGIHRSVAQGELVGGLCVPASGATAL